MMKLFHLALLLGSITTSHAREQSLTQTSSSTISTTTSVPGDYSGHYRPQLHFSPPSGFMNDPNGLFLDANGTYHLYYQYNPNSTIAGNQHWGHATSPDLYTWTNQPIALSPYNNSFIFSGSAVIDANNTSGLFPNQTNGVVAIYTLAGTIQTQDIAYSRDGGYTFEIYEGNPVLSINNANFRDPKVFWYDDGTTSHWVMAVAVAQEFTVSIYTSPNLTSWMFASNFSHHGLLGSQYECPNLVHMPVYGGGSMWLLYISINPGAPVGGSIGQYFPGEFNGTHFIPSDSATRIADFGKDNYATQFWSGVDGISIAWASNWQYCNLVPTGPAEGWQSTMSLPRQNHLRQANRNQGLTMVSLPHNLQDLRASEVIARTGNLGSNGTLLADVGGASGAFMLDVNVTSLNVTELQSTASINFTLIASGSQESIEGGTFVAEDATMWLDRGGIHGWDNVYFTNRFSASLVLNDTYDFQVVVDRSIIEVFGSEGEKSATLVYYPETLLDTVVIRSSGLNEGVSISAVVHMLEGTWEADVSQPNGTAVGTNGTRRALERELEGAWHVGY